MEKRVAIVTGMLLALPIVGAASGGLVGDCYDCHTMHNSELGQPVAQVGGAAGPATSAEPIQNLLRLDCVACHANDPTGGTKKWTMDGGSTVPQVSHPSDDNLAGGNFRYSTENQRHGHNVIDITPADDSNAYQIQDGETIFGAPPGMVEAQYHSTPGSHSKLGPHSSLVFTTSSGIAFDAFTCAGARGCHGTRSQVIFDYYADVWGNRFEHIRRTGIAAISGAHHNSYDGAKTSDGYVVEQVHNGQIVAEGYRFIPGLKGYGNEVDRWQNVDENSHNEYYGDMTISVGESSSCGICHIQGHGIDTDGDGAVDGGWGYNTRAAANSTLRVPGNSMSGFCATCHGMFHPLGTETGTSGAFLRHPSDWVIPDRDEYAAYTSYDITAPVARSSVYTAADSTVTPGTDMVMCLSCHMAHASPYDYMLRFDYTAMTAGGYADTATATAEGCCLACHTTKGVLPENR